MIQTQQLSKHSQNSSAGVGSGGDVCHIAPDIVGILARGYLLQLCATMVGPANRVVSIS